MAAFSNVNADGVPLNVSQAVKDDTDARNLAAQLRGPRSDPYYQPMRSLSIEDEEVHEVYETLFDIVNNPQKYTAEQINNTIVEITEEDGSPVQKYGRFDGNYNADLADRNSNVYKYWRNYRSHKKQWDAKRDKMVAKKKQELDAKGMKITDEMTPKQKREMAAQRTQLLMEVKKKYDRGMLGQQIYYLLGKVDEILENGGYKKEEESVAAYMPSSANLKRQARARELLKGKSLPNISALKLRAKQRKEERRKRMAAAAVTSTAKPKAEASVAKASAKPPAKPSVKVMYGDRWIGPYTSRTTGKKYWTRERDRLSVYVSSNGELTEGKIRATEEAKAKKATKKGGRRTRKKRGGIDNSREWVVENTEASINRFANSDIPESWKVGFQKMLVTMTNGVMNGGFWIIEWSLTRATDDDYGNFHLAWTDDDTEPEDFIRFVDGQNAVGGRKKRKKRKKKKKKKTHKMKGGHHLYKRLGVSKYASQKTIKKAYNKIKKNKKITNKVKYAYKILSKKKTRKQYNNKYVKHKKLKRKKNKR